MKRIAILTVLLVFVAFAMSAYAKDKKVIVVNEPTVHVGSMPDVNVATMPHVNIDSMPDINIANTDLNPVPVIDAAAFQPFQERIYFSLVQGDCGKTGEFAVPLGKRAVIEHFSAWAGVPESQKVTFSLGTRLNGMLQFHVLVATEQGTFPQVMGLGPKAMFVASQPIRVYADPDTEVIFSMGRNSCSGEGYSSAVISGYLVEIE